MPLITPPPLRPGDRIAFVAPSSPFDRARYDRGLTWLSARYAVTARDDLFTRRGYLAGDDARRRDEFAAALADPTVKAVVAARGGYGATRFAHTLDWATFARAPKWLVGFSDVTALHVEATRAGVRSLHGAMVCSLGDADEQARDLFRGAIEGEPPAPWTALQPWSRGTATGPAFGGNLALLEASAASGRLVVPDGAILFVEDCTERPYRVDRMLTSLLVGGHLARVCAVVVGGFTDCNPGPDGVTVEDVLRERLLGLGVPVVADAPFGHGDENRPWIVGAPCTVEGGDTARVTFG
ncbi:MAG: LD-carboxypeptidase [Myxococcales bacterium]|nr:LD-carboxypeptidase [Myxococcales bacterium]